MIRSTLAVCAESIVRDSETNNISVFNIIEELRAPGFPIVFPKLSTLFVLERDKEDPSHVEGTVIIRLDEKELAQAAINGDFENTLRTRIILTAQGVVID